MNEKRECIILGYGKYTSKDTQEEMFRIVLGIDSNRENYSGTMVAAAHLNYNEILENNLKRAIMDSDAKCYYTTTDDIVSGKTKVNNIIVE